MIYVSDLYVEEAAGEEEKDGADDDLKTRTPHNDVGKNEHQPDPTNI